LVRIPKDEFVTARTMIATALMARTDDLTCRTLPLSDQAEQRRAPEENNKDGNGECLALLAGDDFELFDRSEFPD